MATGRITVRVNQAIQERLETIAQATGKTESEIVREAIEEFLAHQRPLRTCFDVAKKAGVIGCVKGGPRDMSTNPKHMKGFGRD